MPLLEPSPDEFRSLADRVGGLAVDFVADLERRRTMSATSGPAAAAAFELPLPEAGVGEAIIHDLEEISEHLRAPTGRRLPYVVGSGELIAALGDFYASVLTKT